MFNEIKDFAAPELDVYARTSEVQLLRYYEPELGIFIAESPKVIERARMQDISQFLFWWSIKIWKERHRKS